MKNLVLATVSFLALSSFANAQQDANMNDAHKAAESRAMAAANSHQPAVPAAQAQKAMAHQQGHTHMKHKHHAHKHHAHKHHGHKHYGVAHPYPNEAEIGGIFVSFPPTQSCTPDFYQGNSECPYVCHGGYFWYPHPQADRLAGYTPAQLQGMYWYASHMHPYMVYTNRTTPTYVLPYNLALDASMYAAQAAPMTPKWESAPNMRSSSGK